MKMFDCNFVFLFQLMVIVYLLNLAWILILCCMVVLTLICTLLWGLCHNLDFIHSKKCIDLTQFCKFIPPSSPYRLQVPVNGVVRSFDCTSSPLSYAFRFPVSKYDKVGRFKCLLWRKSETAVQGLCKFFSDVPCNYLLHCYLMLLSSYRWSKPRFSTFYPQLRV